MGIVVFDCDGTLADTRMYPTRIFSGIKELLLDLSLDHRIYIWTARGRQSTLRILEENGISALFEEICTPDDALPKPNIQGLLEMLGEVPRKSVCIIGDSPMDMVGARNFGALALGATWSKTTSDSSLKASGADFIVSHPSECSKLIRSNLTEA